MYIQLTTWKLCNRIVIIDKGKMIAAGTKESLKDSISIGEKVTLEVSKFDKKIANEIKELENVINVENEDNTMFITYKKGEENLEKLMNFLKEKDIKYSKIFSELPSLNDVFLELTGKELRD